MATILIQEGTLHPGDILVAGRTFGKVRAMLDDLGNTLEEAWPVDADRSARPRPSPMPAIR